MRTYLILLSALLIMLTPNFSSLFAQNPNIQISVDGWVYDLEWSSDGEFLALALESGVSIYVDDALVTHLESSLGEIAQISWQGNGSMLAMIGVDSPTVEVRDWDVWTDTFTFITTFNVTNEFVSAVSWSPDGEKLAVIDNDLREGLDGFISTVEIWDVQSWTLQTRVERSFLFAPPFLAWNSDSTTIVSGRFVCYANSGNMCSGFPQFYTANADDGTIIKYTEEDPNRPRAIAWSANGDLAISAESVIIYNSTMDGILYEWNLDSSSGSANALDWNTDGSLLAAVNSDRILSIFDMSTQSVLVTTEALQWATLIDWNPVYNELAIGAHDGHIEIVDVDALLQAAPTATPLQE